MTECVRQRSIRGISPFAALLAGVLLTSDPAAADDWSSIVPDFCESAFASDSRHNSGCGDFDERTRLTDDWGGSRTSLEEHGITFNATLSQFYFGVAHGGIRQTDRYGGHSDYLLDLDFDKMGLADGFSVRLRAERRFRESVAPDVGVVLSPTLHASTPSPATEEVILTNVLFTQVVDENLTVFFGKLDTLDGDRNPFASGRGVTQFSNTSLLVPVNAIPAVPFATLGAGAIFSVDGMPFAQLMVLNATDTLTTSGLDELFADGAVIYGGVNVPVPICGKMGIHSFNGAWSSKRFTALGQDPRVITGNVPITPSTGSWVVWWSGTQYLYQDPDDPMKGWGLFGRLGAADEETSPIEYMVNFGIGGQSPLRGRENDQFGVGWFYNRFSDQLGPIATAALGLGNTSTGVEVYYNYAVTPFFHVTPDLQVIEPGSNRSNTALVLGLRAVVNF